MRVVFFKSAGLFLFTVLAAIPVQTAELTIFATADIHGRAENLAALVKRTENVKNLIRIDCGDTTQGTAAAAGNCGAAMIELLSALHFDVWVPGNHDFDFGAAALARNAAMFRGTTLGANWSIGGYRKPAGHILVRRGNRTAAIIGLTDPKEYSRLIPDSGFVFYNEDKVLRRELDIVLPQHPDIIILVWHAGLHTPEGSMYRFLARFPEVDMLIAAHSHERIPGIKVAGAFAVQPGEYGENAVLAEIDFTPDRKPVIKSRLIQPEKRNDFPNEIRILISDAEKSAGNCIKMIPELSGEAVAAAGAAAMMRFTGCDAAIFTVSSHDDGMTLPDTSAESLFSFLPYENNVVLIEVTGSELQKALAKLQQLIKKRHLRYAFAGKNGLKTLTLALPDYYALQLFPEKIAAGSFSGTGISVRPLLKRHLENPPNGGR